MRVDGALGAAGLYLAAQELLRPQLAAVFEDSVCGGTPCWRATLVLLPQLLLLPTLTALAACEQRTLQLGLSTTARASLYVFYASMGVDLLYAAFMPGVIRPLILKHHAVSVCATWYATHLLPRASGRHLFVVNISLLEFGSGLCNTYWILKPTPYAAAATLLYAVGMTLTHAIVCYMTWLWNARARDAGVPGVGRWLPLAGWFCMLFMRQREMHRLTMHEA